MFTDAVDLQKTSTLTIHSMRLPRTVFEEEQKKLILPPELTVRLKKFGQLWGQIQKNRIYNGKIKGFLLFQGPPGCGKTTAAHGFAQLLSKQYLNYFGQETHFFQLDGPALFSEFLGQTAKTLDKWFEAIAEPAAKTQTVALINEIESIGLSRTRLNSGDPSEVLRVVIAFLHHIDALGSNPNFIIIATTNLSTLLDSALEDRADLVISFKNPDPSASLQILRQSAEEALRLGIVVDDVQLQKVVEMLFDSNLLPSGRLLSRLVFLGYVAGDSEEVSAAAMFRIARETITMDRMDHG